MAYATTDDLAGYVDVVPSNAPTLLERASRAVDQALLCAVYDTDDTDIQAALRAATCEHAAFGLESGDGTGTGAAAGYGSISIGSVALSRADNSRDTVLAPQAWMVLQLAGLTGHSPQAP